jgi:glycosyltransferase involved in cell wall biosynthesis
MSAQRKTKVLIVASHILGGKSFSTQLAEAAARLEDIEVELVVLSEMDYKVHRSAVSWRDRLSSPLESSAVARAKAGKIHRERADVLVLQSFDLLPGFREAVAEVPTIVFHDSTNIASYELERDTSRRRLRKFRYAIKKLLLDRFYRDAAKNVRCFLPRTAWCARSLKAHFSIPDERIIVSPAGLDLKHWTVAASHGTTGRPEVLFVGNDLERKGVDILLQCWKSSLCDRADLVIVTNDPVAKRLGQIQGVKIVTDLRPGRELRALFQRAALFVFPTRKEHMGLVLTEAAASGLPIIASDVGGVSEIVRDNRNGILLNLNASAADWGKAIQSLLDDPQRRLAMGRSSRELAETHLSQEVLEGRLQRALSIASGAR